MRMSGWKTAVLVAVPTLLAACSDDSSPANPATTGGGNAGSGNAGTGNAGTGNAGTGGGGGNGGAGSTDGGDVKVGLITKENGNPFFAKMKEGAEAEATVKGATLIAELGA